jgi:hypothetical protein
MVAPLQIGGGITFGSGISAGPDNKVVLPPVLVLNLDAASYSAVPADGTTIAGAGNYTITTLNPGGSMVWSATNGGIFQKMSAADTDFLTFGPNFSTTTQPYTVMMVYRSQPAQAGRLLNANSASPDWLAGLWGSSGYVQDIFFNGNFVGANTDAADGNWQFIWATYNGDAVSPLSQSYVANSAVPTTAFGTSSTNGGFDGLRLFGRYLTPTSSSEVPTADVGLVKLWDGVLTLPQIQTQYAGYKARFGY